MHASASLVGSWTLLAWKRETQDGSVSYPLGENASGLLVYTAHGDMAVQLVAADRAKIETSDPLLGGDDKQRAAAYATCLAYFGRYEVHRDEVVHLVQSSLFPNWSGQRQVRPFTLEGDTLTLHTPPVHLLQGDVTNALIWKRLH